MLVVDDDTKRLAVTPQSVTVLDSVQLVLDEVVVSLDEVDDCSLVDERSVEVGSFVELGLVADVGLSVGLFVGLSVGSSVGSGSDGTSTGGASFLGGLLHDFMKGIGMHRKEMVGSFGNFGRLMEKPVILGKFCSICGGHHGQGTITGKTVAVKEIVRQEEL